MTQDEKVEAGFAVEPAELAERRRINAVCHPSTVQQSADREDLITYAKEVVRLRAAIAALSTVEEPTTGDAVREALQARRSIGLLRASVVIYFHNHSDAVNAFHALTDAALAQSQPTPTSAKDEPTSTAPC